MHETAGMMALLPVAAGCPPGEYRLNAVVASGTRHVIKHLDACAMREVTSDVKCCVHGAHNLA